MQPRKDIYQLSLDVSTAEDTSAALSLLPITILQCIANQVPLQIFPNDTEDKLINRLIQQQQKEFEIISPTTYESVFPIEDKYDSIKTKYGITHLLEKNNLLEQANLKIAEEFNNKRPILKKELNDGLYLNIVGTGYDGKLSRIPLLIVNQLIEKNKTTPLRGINISHNVIQIFPDALSECKNVRFINISNNKLETLPKSFSQFTNVDTLYMLDNQFVSFPEVICNLKKLSYLKVNSNPIRFIPEKISQLTALVDFHLDYCHLQTLPLGLTHLTYLKTLSLTGNSFKMYTFKPEIMPILKNTRSSNGYGSNYNKLYRHFERPEDFSPTPEFVNEYKEVKANESRPSSSISLNHFHHLAKTICDKKLSATTTTHQQSEALRLYKKGDYHSSAMIYKNLVDESKECDIHALYNLASALIKLNTPENLIKARSYLVTASLLSDDLKYKKRLLECQVLIDKPTPQLEEKSILKKPASLPHFQVVAGDNLYPTGLPSFKRN